MKRSAVLILALMLAGCSGMSGGPTSWDDRFSGVHINATGGNLLPNHAMESYRFALDMRQEVRPASTNYYFMVSLVAGNGVTFVPAVGESLFLLIDNTNRSALVATTHQETSFVGKNFYPTTAEQLRSVASAQSVEVRLLGIKGRTWEQKLTPKNVENFRDFVAKFLPP